MNTTPNMSMPQRTSHQGRPLLQEADALCDKVPLSIAYADPKARLKLLPHVANRRCVVVHSQLAGTA